MAKAGAIYRKPSRYNAVLENDLQRMLLIVIICDKYEMRPSKMVSESFPGLQESIMFFADSGNWFLF